MKKIKRDTIVSVLLGVLPILAITSIVLVTKNNQKQSSFGLTPTDIPSASASPTALVQPVAEETPSPSVSPNASASTAASASPEAVEPGALPSSAKTIVDNFFAAYKAKDSDRLSKFFSPDVSVEDKTEHSLLFRGVDLNGNPGGPTLFSTNSAGQSVKEYSISSVAKSGNNYLVTTREQRLYIDGSSSGETVTIMELAPAGAEYGGWQINYYQHTGSSGKYDAFLIE